LRRALEPASRRQPAVPIPPSRPPTPAERTRRIHQQIVDQRPKQPIRELHRQRLRSDVHRDDVPGRTPRSCTSTYAARARARAGATSRARRRRPTLGAASARRAIRRSVRFTSSARVAWQLDGASRN
jgi:hypothetical protein